VKPEEILKIPSEIAQYQVVTTALRNHYKQCLFHTAKDLLGYKEMVHHVHEEICHTLQRDSQRKLIVMPRGTFKTSLAVISYAIWRIINCPNIRILIDSEFYQNSKNSLREIKGHLQSNAVVELFGKFYNDACWNETEIIVTQRDRIIKEPTIVCSGIGAQKTGQHYDLIIADDLNSDKNTNTPENCRKVIDHYRYYTSILEPEGTIVVIGTRYSANDLIGHIVMNEIETEGMGLL
jgi:hypothetical protein